MRAYKCDDKKTTRQKKTKLCSIMKEAAKPLVGVLSPREARGVVRVKKAAAEKAPLNRVLSPREARGADREAKRAAVEKVRKYFEAENDVDGEDDENQAGAEAAAVAAAAEEAVVPADA